MATATEIIQSVFARWKRDIAPAWEDGTYTPNEDQFAEMAVEAVEIDREQRTAPKLIAGLVLWTPGGVADFEYRSLEFSGTLTEQFQTATTKRQDEYANARQFIIAVPGDLNDMQIVKYIDARLESIKEGFDVWTVQLTLTQV